MARILAKVKGNNIVGDYLMYLEVGGHNVTFVENGFQVVTDIVATHFDLVIVSSRVGKFLLLEIQEIKPLLPILMLGFDAPLIRHQADKFLQRPGLFDFLKAVESLLSKKE